MNVGLARSSSVLIVLAILTACGGGGGSQSAGQNASGDSATSAPPKTSAAAESPVDPQAPANVAGLVYVANRTSNNISAYTIDANTGGLSEVAGSPFPAGLSPRALVVDPSQKFVYVPCSGSNNVSAYGIDPATGVLHEIAGSPFPASNGPWAITFHASGKFAYVVNYGSGEGSGDISAYTINATTGAMSQVAGSPFWAGNSPQPMTVDPSGKFAYVSRGNHGSDGSVATFAIDATTGALATIQSGISTEAVSPSPVIVAPSGRFAYVSNIDSIVAYGIDASTGVLTRVGARVPAGHSSRTSLIDPTGRFAYVGNSNNDLSGTVAAYGIDPVTGQLTPVGDNPFATGTLFNSFTVHPSGKFLYVSNFGEPMSVAGNVTAFAIDGMTGTLSEIASSPVSTGGNPVSVNIDPSGRAAYVVNSNSNDISAYTIDGTSGALTSVGKIPAGTGPVALAITRTAR